MNLNLSMNKAEAGRLMVTLMRLRKKLMITGGGGEGDDDNKGEGDIDNRYSKDAACFFLRREGVCTRR